MLSRPRICSVGFKRRRDPGTSGAAFRRVAAFAIEGSGVAAVCAFANVFNAARRRVSVGDRAITTARTFGFAGRSGGRFGILPSRLMAASTAEINFDYAPV
ncbi:MAG: hypothetical protein KGP27_01905 [Hyphomicrobiales bacterium]|nr:hypothetical protein [Hyphomicrobiales bacterium]